MPTLTANRTLYLAVLVWLLAFGLGVNSLRGDSPTFDEQGFLVRGVAYLRGENRHIRVGHPLGLNALNAALLAADSQVALPVDDPSWSGTNFHRPAELFLWEIGNDVERLMLLGRLPTLWLFLLLTAVAGRWARAITRQSGAAIIAISLLALDPNMLAHGRLATTDLGLAAGALLAGYSLWRWWRRPTPAGALLAGVALGLLQNTKFTAALFIPIFALIILVGLRQHWPARQHRRSLLLQLLVFYPGAALLTLWGAYGFDVGTLPETLPTLSALGGRTLPLAHHLEQMLDIGGRLQKSTPAFLLGDHRDDGWWYYFPVAFALKTPLATLLLLAWGLLRLARRPLPHRALTLAALLLPPLGYFAFALTTEINLGYRHLLPLLPFLAVASAVALAGPMRRGPALARSGLLGWLAIATLAAHPHYISFFNPLAGGPANGWRALVDSNHDWGQDLARLAAWQRETDAGAVWLSYFGEGRPDYYAIDYLGLPSWPPRLTDPAADPLYSPEPAPGLYAISTTNLQGVHFDDHGRFAWFRDRTPLATAGHSIRIYEVPATGPPVNLALGGVTLPQIEAADYALLGSNDVRPRWFDPASSLLWPAGGGWLALPPGYAVPPPLAALLPAPLDGPLAAGAGYALYRLEGAVNDEPAPALFTSEDGRVALRRAVVPPAPVGAGESVTILTIWEQQGGARPLKAFVHALAADGRLVAQWDGLSLVATSWLPGDQLYQLSTINFPHDSPPGEYRLVAGLYDPAPPYERWRNEQEDSVFLGTITLDE